MYLIRVPSPNMSVNMISGFHRIVCRPLGSIRSRPSSNSNRHDQELPSCLENLTSFSPPTHHRCVTDGQDSQHLNMVPLRCSILLDIIRNPETLPPLCSIDELIRARRCKYSRAIGRGRLSFHLEKPLASYLNSPALISSRLSPTTIIGRK